VMVKAQGGDTKCLENPSLYPKSLLTKAIRAPRSGWIKAIDALEIGFAGNILGVGRMKVDDKVDPKAGVIFRKKVGNPVMENEVVAVCYSDDKEKMETGSLRIEKAFQYSAEQCSPPTLIHAIIDESGTRKWDGAK
jgi:pyrimidine-nucleoside phosphorylase